MESAASPADRIFRFGQFELSEREGEVRKNGIRIKLQEQPFRVLLELVAKAGNVVTREELQQKLWPADTFVDFDVGLNTAIRKIRQALGDDADRPHYIETAAKRGYRFLAPVSQLSAVTTLGGAPILPSGNPVSALPDAVASERSPASERYRRPNFLLSVIAVIAIAVAAVLGLGRLHRGVSGLVVERRITANPVEAPVRAAVISLDGKYVAYADRTGTYLRLIDSGETHPLPLPKDFTASPSSWFPDGTHLLLTRLDRLEKKSSLWKASILGGAPQMLTDDAEDASVSPDGSQIAFFRRSHQLQRFQGANSVNTVVQLWLMASNGESPKEILGPENLEFRSLGNQVTAMTWAPNGHRIAYIERHTNMASAPLGNSYWLRTQDVAGGESQTILSDHRIAAADICWGPDGRVFYALRADPKNQRSDYGVWAIRVDPETGKATGNPEQVSDGLGWIGRLTISADGKRLLLWRGNTQAQVFISEFDKGNHRLNTPRRLTMDENESAPTAWMPDSKSVLFTSDRDGSWKLFRQDIDQPIAEVVIDNQNVRAALPRLSADGSQILFADIPKPYDPLVPIRLMSMPLSGGIPRLVFQDVGINNFFCARPPSRVCVLDKVVGTTTSFITFDTDRGKGREVARFEGWLNWGLSPNGSQLVVVTDDRQGRLRFLSLDTGAVRDVVVKDWPVLRGADWAADGQSVLTGSVTARGTSVILEVDMEGKARVLLESDPQSQFLWAIPSPDGQYAALNVFTGENNVWMLENF